MSSEEIKADYTSSLSDLTSNSKPLINVLTMLAEENILHASDIVTAIEEHLSKVHTDVKLPILYLVDSVVKNIGGNYRELFSQNLVKTFCTVFKVVDEKTRAEMFKLRQTWNDLFPQQKLYAIDVQINMLDPAWPVTAKPPSNRIHLNPKFLNSASSTAAGKFNKKTETKVAEVDDDASTAEVSPIMDPDTFSMQQKLIQKQKELIELQQKKLELELLQTKVKLQNQLKNNRQAGAPISAQNILLKPEVAKQLIPGAVRATATKQKAPPMGSNQRVLVSGAKVTPVNSALVAAGSKPTRDPRLLRQQAEKINNGSGSSIVNPAPPSKTSSPSKLVANNKTLVKPNASSSVTLPPKVKSSPTKSRPKSRTKSSYDSRSSTTSSSKSSSCSDSPIKSKSDVNMMKSPSRHGKKKDYLESKKIFKDLSKQRERDGKSHGKVITSPTTFKGIKGATKNRNYIRRNRSPSYSPENKDVDFRKADQQPHLEEKVMDVDLRQLPAVVGKKRLSTEGLDQSASKKSKTEVFDVLFGNEDTDLRKLPPVVAERPPTPPPPIISQEDKKESAKASNFEFVRAKLANATGRDKIMAKSFRKKRPAPEVDSRTPQQTSPLADTMKKIIISQDVEQCIKAGTMTKEQEKQLMNKIIAQMEHHNLKEAQRKDSEQSIDGSSGVGGLQPVSDEELDVGDEDGQFGDKDDRLAFPKYGQLRRGGPYWRGGGAKRRHWDGHGSQQQQQVAPPMGHPSRGGGGRPWMQPHPVNPWRPVGPNFTRPSSHHNLPNLPNEDGKKSPEIAGDLVVNSASQDDSKTINIDGVPRDIRNYDEISIVFMSWDDPREISFQNGTRRVAFDDSEIYLLSFNEPYKEIVVKGAPHKVRLGAPSRELFVDGVPYECYFGGPGITIELDGRMVGVKLDGPPPQVKIGTTKRSDLVAGKVNLIVDAKILVPVYLDGKVQKFAIDGETYTLKFVDALKTVLINDVALDVEFGGLPKPIIVHDKKHFIRFPVLPRGVKPGYVDIKDMEGCRVGAASSGAAAASGSGAADENSQDASLVSFDINQPALPVFARRNARPEDDAERNSNSPHSFQSFMQQTNLDMLSSVMTTSLAPSTPGGGYQVEGQSGGALAENTNANNPVSLLPPSLNINDLFQKLVATGIVASNKEPQADGAEAKTVKRLLQNLKPVTFKKRASLKLRQAALYEALYCGMQCSSCGMRFPPEQSIHYSQHLDWHFRQNRKGKKNIRVASSRRWYYSLSDWKNFEEIEDLEEREKNYFDQQQSQAEGAGDDADEETEIPSVLADPDTQEARCEVCQDKFDHFFNEEKEEWHLRNAIRVEDRTYHPICYDDYQNSLLNETNKEEPPKEEIVEKPEERGIPGLEIILDDDDENDAENKEPENEDDYKKSEEVVIEESDESKSSDKEDGKELEDDDDVILNEVAPEKIEVDDDNDYKEYTNCGLSDHQVNVKVEQIDDGFMDIEEGLLKMKNGGQIKIKSEPIDPDEQVIVDLPEEPKAVVDTTRAGLISSIDGNTEPSSGIPVTTGNVTGKIRINISKPMMAVAPKEREICDSPSVPETVIDPSQPPPPGEEPPVQLHVKPALQGLELKKMPPVRKGSELTGMCSIM